MADRPRVFKNNRPRAREFNSKSHIDKLYKGEWQHYSRAFLKLNNKCIACGSPSQACDHMVVHRGNSEMFWNRENHIPLCHSCHNTITSRFDKRSPQDIQGKLKWIHMMREKFELDDSVSVKITPFAIPTVTINDDPMGLKAYTPGLRDTPSGLRDTPSTAEPKGRDAVLAYLDKKVNQ